MKNKILEKYRICWENHDLKLLEELFHTEIVYQEKVDNIFIGIDKLKEYWINNSKKQRDVVFKVLSHIESEPFTVAHWEANFYHLLKCKQIYIEGIMWIKENNGKIISFTEFFELKENNNSEYVDECIL